MGWDASPAPHLMPIYQFYCRNCGCVEESIRPASESSNGLGCFNCGESMTRVYSAPMVMNRSKPGSFKFDPAKITPWDSRLAALRLAESQGAESQRQAKKNFGGAYYKTLQYKKEKYG